MRVDVPFVAAIAAVLLGGCNQRVPKDGEDVAGAEKSARTRTLETGAALLQRKGPLSEFNVYLDGFLFANGRPDEQSEAHHYCQVVNEDFRQCVLFDGNASDAKLVGIEYVVSRRVFEQLPVAERTLWHSHAYEVSSGLLIGPGLPQDAEHELMEQLAGTYGKTWHTWHTERDGALPAGIPTLMTGFTADEQIEPSLVRERDRRFDIDTAERRVARSDIEAPGILPGADAWQFGEPMQLLLQPVVASTPASREREPDRDEAIQTPRRRSLESRRRDAFAGLDPVLDTMLERWASGRVRCSNLSVSTVYPRVSRAPFTRTSRVTGATANQGDGDVEKERMDATSAAARPLDRHGLAHDRAHCACRSRHGGQRGRVACEQW